MNKFFYLLTVAAFALVPLAAGAADLPAKAPAPRVLQTYAGSGFYFGLGTFGEVDRTSITGTAGEAMSADVAGGALSLVGGYMWGDGTSWKAVEATFNYHNIGGSNVAVTAIPASMDKQIGFTQRFMLGGPLASVLNLLPNLSTYFPVFPPPTGTTTTHPYIFAAVHEDDVSASYLASSAKVWRVRSGLGVGIKQQLGAVQGNPAASQVTMDTWAEYMIPGSGITLGNVAGFTGTANQGAGARVGVTLEY